MNYNELLALVEEKNSRSYNTAISNVEKTFKENVTDSAVVFENSCWKLKKGNEVKILLNVNTKTVSCGITTFTLKDKDFNELKSLFEVLNDGEKKEDVPESENFTLLVKIFNTVHKLEGPVLKDIKVHWFDEVMMISDGEDLVAVLIKTPEKIQMGITKNPNDLFELKGNEAGIAQRIFTEIKETLPNGIPDRVFEGLSKVKAALQRLGND